MVRLAMVDEPEETFNDENENENEYNEDIEEAMNKF